MSDHGGVSAGWYPDPNDPGMQRYWDGNAWTEHTAPLSGVGPQGSTAGSSTFPSSTGGQPAARVDTWLWQSIVVTLLCCLPLGIVGIVFASQAQSALSVGNVQEARDKANTARLMCLIGLGVGLVLIVGWFLLVFVSAIGAGSGF